jgi:hypothetical protein
MGWGLAMEAGARRLSTHQKAVLIQVLLTLPEQRVEVCYSPAASDALDYARDFLTIFKVIGWEVEQDAPSANGTVVEKGLAVVASTADALPPGAEAFRDALRIYGVEVATICDPRCGMRPGGFILAVGAGES